MQFKKNIDVSYASWRNISKKENKKINKYVVFLSLFASVPGRDRWVMMSIKIFHILSQTWGIITFHFGTSHKFQYLRMDPMVFFLREARLALPQSSKLGTQKSKLWFLLPDPHSQICSQDSRTTQKWRENSWSAKVWISFLKVILVTSPLLFGTFLESFVSVLDLYFTNKKLH